MQVSSVTENGALSCAGTGSAVLDLFFKTVRNTPVEQLGQLLSRAWEESPLDTLKVVFHLRDCRGGKGERARFHDCLRWLVGNGHGAHVRKNLEHVPFYGTYKDLFSLCGTGLEFDALRLYARQLRDDVDSVLESQGVLGKVVDVVGNGVGSDRVSEGSSVEIPVVDAGGNVVDVLELVKKPLPHANISLAGKWAPTEGGSVDRKYKLVRKLVGLLRGEFAPTHAQVSDLKMYRKNVLGVLRRHLDIVERHMCERDWSGIDFAHVPSVAMKTYRKAFAKHEKERFDRYLADVKSGKTKINAAALFPHQLVEHYLNGGAYDEVVEQQWIALVNNMRGLGSSSISRSGVSKNSASRLGQALAIVDVSGSMQGIPMNVAIALSLILAELSEGPLRGSLITFSASPNMFRVNVEDSLMNKVSAIRSMEWGMNTNLNKVFELLLNQAQMYALTAEQMPATLYIFSDMQFDVACSDVKTGPEGYPPTPVTNFTAIEQRYLSAGYKRPNIVFWNLRGDTVDFPVEKSVPDTALVSGFSPSLMQLFMSGKTLNPYDVMRSAIDAQRYSRITLA